MKKKIFNLVIIFVLVFLPINVLASNDFDTNILTMSNVSDSSNSEGENAENSEGWGRDDIDGATCNALFTPEAVALSDTILFYIQVMAPIVLIVMITIDFSRAVIAKDDKEIRKAYAKSLKRILAAVGLFFVPLLVRMLLSMPAIKNGLSINDDPLCTDVSGTESSEYEWNFDEISDYIPGQGGTMDGISSFGPGGKHYLRTITVNGRTFYLYKQWLYEGGFKNFRGGRDFAEVGCAPSAAAIALSGYDSSITPEVVINALGSNWTHSSRGEFTRAINNLGYKTSDWIFYNSNDNNQGRINSIASQVKAHLATGMPVVGLLTTKSSKSACSGFPSYSGGNHFFSVIGMDPSGKAIIAHSGRGSDDYIRLEDIMNCFMGGGQKGFVLVYV